MTELRPVTLADDAICGTDDRVMYAAALLMLALVAAAGWVVFRLTK